MEIMGHLVEEGVMDHRRKGCPSISRWVTP